MKITMCKISAEDACTTALYNVGSSSWLAINEQLNYSVLWSYLSGVVVVCSYWFVRVQLRDGSVRNYVWSDSRLQLDSSDRLRHIKRLVHRTNIRPRWITLVYIAWQSRPQCRPWGKVNRRIFTVLSFIRKRLLACRLYMAVRTSSSANAASDHAKGWVILNHSANILVGAITLPLI